MSLILVDTNALVALVDARDALHERARNDLKGLDGSAFATCEAVLSETCFRLPNRTQRERLRAVLDELMVAAAPSSSSQEYVDAVFDWLVKYAEHEPDWTDGCLAVLSAQDASARVWTYDRKFRTTWRRPNGTRIPLAVR